MTILDIAELGNPILRCQAQSIDQVREPKILQLIDDLITTAASHNGVGIAAPQVSESYRLFIVASLGTKPRKPGTLKQPSQSLTISLL